MLLPARDIILVIVKLKRLELKNFGSHKNTVVDFESKNVSESPIVIITGDTGVGKTTLLDGIIFALYRNVFRYSSKDVSSLRRYDSQDEETYSLVVFETLGKTFSVKRSINVERNNNEGNNDLEYSLEVWEDGRKIALNKKKLDEKIEKEILRCNYKVFTRSIILPQGEFSALLKTDDPSERRDILGKIFTNLEVYEIIKRKIDERERDAISDYNLSNANLDNLSAELKNQKEKLEKTLSELAQETELDQNLLNLLHNPKDQSDLIEAKNRIVSVIGKKISDLEGHKRSLEGKKEEENEKIRKLSEILREAERVKSLEDEVNERKGRILEILRNLSNDLYLKFRLDEPTLNDELEALEKEIKEEKEKAEKIKEELKEVKHSYDLKKVEYQELEKKYNSLKSRIRNGGKEIIGRECSNRNELKEARRLLKERIEEMEEELRKIDVSKLDERRKKLEDSERAVEQKRELESDINSLREEINKVDIELNNILERMKKVEKELELERSKEVEYCSLRIRETLKDGDLCPVCNNTYFKRHEHKVVEGKEAERLLEVIKNLESELQKLNSGKSSLEARREEKKKTIEKLEKSMEKIDTLLREIGLSPDSLESERREIDDLRKRRDEINSEKSKFEVNLTKLEGLLSEIEFRYNSEIVPGEENLLRFIKEFQEKGIVREILGNTRFQRIREFFGSNFEAKLESRLEAVTRKLNNIENILNEVSELKVKCRELNEKRKGIVQNLNEIEEKLREAEREVAELENEIKRIEEKIKNLSTGKGDIIAKIENAASIMEKLARVEKEVEEKGKKLDILMSLNRKFDTKGIVNFVFKVKMTELADKVNEYLERLGIQDKKLTVDFNENNLTFSVMYPDGTKNNINSLSGGESFLFSISLAFAVANDVISTSNIKSIFIDEGFDTLDENHNTRLFAFLESFAMEKGITIYIITHKKEIAENTNYPQIRVSKESGKSKVEIQVSTILTSET